MAFFETKVRINEVVLDTKSENSLSLSLSLSLDRIKRNSQVLFGAEVLYIYALATVYRDNLPNNIKTCYSIQAGLHGFGNNEKNESLFIYLTA